METYLGLDLGGTKLLIGQVDSQGNVLRHKKYDSRFRDQRDAAGIICSALDDYIGKVGFEGGSPAAMGVGLVGRVDAGSGIWLQIDPRRTDPIPLARDLSVKYGMPCHIDNDVKSATRAEQLWGAGSRSRDFIYINVGTGIGAGIVVDGRLVRGSHFNAGEAGHMVTGVNVGIKCGCGRTDCVEMIASGMGLDACARYLKDRYSTSLVLPEGGRVVADEIFRLAQEGDELCSVLSDNAARGIADLIMNLVRTTDPDMIVLGGGIAAGSFMYEKVLSNLNRDTMRFVTGGVVITALDPRFAGLLGAAAVAMDK
jgi:predicted NBD/HSP70 family sugar kinase